MVWIKARAHVNYDTEFRCVTVKGRHLLFSVIICLRLLSSSVQVHLNKLVEWMSWKSSFISVIPSQIVKLVY